MLAYRVSKNAVLLYCFMLDDCNPAGVCESAFEAGANAGLDIKEMRAALKELEAEGLGIQRLESVPIADIGGAKVWGSCVQFVISNYVRPLVLERLSAEAWIRIRTTVFERDDFTCFYCGERGGKLECDHIEPISKGGTNELGNLITACLKCNRAKRTKTLKEWRGRASA